MTKKGILKKDIKMEIKIPQDIVQKAIKCTKKFRCLSVSSDNLCRAICHLSKDLLFVKCMDGKDCAYLESHEKTEMCNCPVRIEIYRRYNL
jgi:hypothetical protein